MGLGCWQTRQGPYCPAWGCLPSPGSRATSRALPRPISRPSRHLLGRISWSYRPGRV